ncbi:phosphoethanolamine transferase [Sulfurimonas marina]|uniref:phosphoethanolamine transferase n=1 Tax=Sulfurimonas marina TaxID=2590551 RepID=UPI001D054DE5|nr:phosphoethanolamine--lipid A transferase [Sulfurimonas marina]
MKETIIKALTQTKLILFTALFLVLFDNYAFFHNVLEVYPFNFSNSGFLISLAVVLFAVTSLLLTLVSSKYTLKPIIILILIVSSMTNYFMNSYKVVIDDTMIRNMMQTDMAETLDLISIKQVLYFIFLGLLPAFLVYKSKIEYGSFKKEMFAKIVTVFGALALVLLSVFIFSKHYTSFFREHKPLRYSTNPPYWIYSTGKYINKTFNSGPIIVKPLGEDAKIEGDANETKKLVIFVVGEAARADHFSLNGYERETNPRLSKEDIINFSNVFSCGTSTAESVPCMFSPFERDEYSYKKGITHENILDVLAHTDDIAVLWRDNNSDSKGMALRVPYENYKSNKLNTICTEDGECRDIGMLIGLDDFIEKNKDKNMFIVLHQMGNHGPAYYKRYPKEFEKYTPVCETNQLEECTQEEIKNAYDNALLYTDFFLSKTISFLKQYDKDYKTAMFYMSDHGESLGEGGVYLHGLPYFMAPDAQTHIGAFMWFGEQMKQDVNMEKIEAVKEQKFTQDNLFHSMLGIFKVKTEAYDKDLDVFNGKH